MTPEQKRQYNAEYYRNNPHLKERAKERKRLKREKELRKQMEQVQKNGLGFGVETEEISFIRKEIAQKGNRHMASKKDTDSTDGGDYLSKVLNAETPNKEKNEPSAKIFDEDEDNGENTFGDLPEKESRHLYLVKKIPEELREKIHSKLEHIHGELEEKIDRRQDQFHKEFMRVSELNLEKFQTALEKVSDSQHRTTKIDEVSDAVSEPKLDWGRVSEWFQIILLVGVLATSGFIVVSENSFRLSEAGHTWPWLMACVLEAAIIGLACFNPKVSFRFSSPGDFLSSITAGFKFIGFKLALATLVGFSFWISMVSEKVSGTEKIAAVSKTEASKDLDKQIEITLAALADFQKKGESGNIAKTQTELRELRELRSSSMQSGDVQNLKSVYEDEKNMKIASKAMPLMINILFGHLLGMMWTRRRES